LRIRMRQNQRHVRSVRMFR